MKPAAFIVFAAAVVLAPYWWLVLGLSSAFGGGVEFPPTLDDFEFAPRIYGVIYGIPLFLIVLFAGSWAATRLIKNKRTHAHNR